ncbi:MAG TPA: hypothetical protein G4O14_02635 [Anaerolineae bacterium]|nr:hypothetical protein [Anaerolineae bacterium]
MTEPKDLSNSQNKADGTDRWPKTRFVATLVLIPSVPLLLLSVAALALFYISPNRFGDLISRLPGESFVRMALVFAPATLFAVVVLALLYAFDRPAKRIVCSELDHGVGAPVTFARERGAFPYAQWFARVSLAPSVLALLASTGFWALSFISPSRFDRLMTPLPGDRYLRPLVPWAPIVLFFIVLLGIYLAFDGRTFSRGVARSSRPVSLAVAIVLVSAAPLLSFTLAALGLYFLSPTRFEQMLARLPYEEFTRLVVTFTPAALLALILLAILYLQKQRIGSPLSVKPNSVRQMDSGFQELRSMIALWVLVGGLILTAVVGLGLLCVVIYIIIR